MTGRICQEANCDDNGNDDGSKDDPEPGLFIMEYRFHPLLHADFAERQGTGGDEVAGDAAF